MLATGISGFGRIRLLSVLAFLVPTLAFADTGDWSPELLDIDTGPYRTPDATIRIQLPEDVSSESLQQLVLEVDAIDVTAMAFVKDGVMIYTPATPMPYGRRIIRLVEHAPDGSILERGFWNMEIRQSENFSEASFNADISLTASQRVGEKNVDTKPDRLQGQGSASLTGVLSNDDWKVDSRASIIYNSQHEQTAYGHQTELGEYLITASRQSDELRVGHHAVPHNNLIMDNFYRRGISGDVGISPLRSTVTGFAMRTDQITGFRDGLGTGDSRNRVDGVAIQTQPLDKDPERLSLLFSYLDGEGPSDGINVGGEDITNNGSAWSAAVDSSLYSQQLRLRGEYAGTGYDFDGRDTGYGEENDKAWSLLAQYTPSPAGDQEIPVNWNIGAEHTYTGTLFRSLANPELAADKQMSRLFGGLGRDTWAIETSFAREEDNLDNNRLLPTTRTYLGYLNLNITQAEPVSEDSFFSWLGTPYHTIAVSYQDQEETDTPFGSTRLPTDNRTDNVQWQAAFANTGWDWGMGLGWSRFQDYSDQTPDQRTLLANLNSNFPLGDRISLSPSVQFQTTKDEDSGLKQYSTVLGLLANLVLIPEKLDANLNFSLSENKVTNSPDLRQDDYTILVSGDIIWHWIAARTNRPGFDVSLNGTWQNVNDQVNTALDETSNQVFLNLIMTLPLAVPGG